MLTSLLLFGRSCHLDSSQLYRSPVFRFALYSQHSHGGLYRNWELFFFAVVMQVKTLNASYRFNRLAGDQIGAFGN